MSRGPDFFIIGAMKAATSTLHVQLGQQPSVFMSEPKEPNFFSDDGQYARGIEWYHGLFAEARPDQLCGESSTHYTKLPTYPQTITRLSRHLQGHERFVYVLRHPVDRLVSQYIHEWTQRAIDEPLERALDRHPELVDYSRYAMQLRPYIEAFGRERILLVFFDAITDQPQQQLERLCSFLGIPGQPKWSEEAGRQNVSNERLRRSPMRDKLLNLPGLTHFRRRFVPRSWRDRIKRLWTPGERPTIRPERLGPLHRAFDEELGQVGEWIGADLNCENFRAVARTHQPDWRTALKGAES